MINYLVRIVNNGVVLREVPAMSKYDAKQRKLRLLDTYPHCTIEVIHGTSSSSQTSPDD